MGRGSLIGCICISADLCQGRVCLCDLVTCRGIQVYVCTGGSLALECAWRSKECCLMTAHTAITFCLYNVFLLPHELYVFSYCSSINL